MSSMTTMDTALLEASAAGDRQAFSGIVERYKSLVCAIVYSSTGDLELSEDLAQDTFVAAWTHLGDLKDRSRFKPWLCSIARNVAKRYLANRCRDVIAEAQSLEVSAGQAAAKPGPRELAISKEEQTVLWRSLEQIPETYRVPLILYYREGQSVQRVSESLNLTPGAVKQRLHRGRQMLKVEMAAFVEQSLAQTRPGKAFGLGVLCALPRISTWTPAAPQVAGPLAEAAAWCLRPFARLLSWCTNSGGTHEAAASVAAAGTEQAAAAVAPEAAAPVAKLASWTAGLGVKHVVAGSIAVATVAGAAAYYTSESSLAPLKMTAGTLVTQYKRASAEQRSFACKYSTSIRRECLITSRPETAERINGVTNCYCSGELATDGFRMALRLKKWGQYRSHEFFPEDKAVYIRNSFDGEKYVTYSRNPRNRSKPHGSCGVELDPLSPDRPIRPYEDSVGKLFAPHYLLGFMDFSGRKLDAILDMAESLTARELPENVNGTDCYVLDIDWEHDHATLWLDPKHGYNIGQAEFCRKSSKGDFTSSYFLSDVSFENIDDVWFPTSGTSESRVSWQGDNEHTVEKHRLTDVELNVDLDARDVFSMDDIEDGANFTYFRVPVRYVWQDGRPVPMDE